MARTDPELTDAKWVALAPLLPPQRPSTGRPNNDHRQVVEAMVWLARTGAPWRDLPAKCGSWKLWPAGFYRWRQQGVFQRLMAEIHRRADACGKLDWLVHYVDGSVVRAHQRAVGTRPTPAPEDLKRGIVYPQDEALGTSRGGLSTKLHLRTDGRRRPLVILATPSQRHEVTQLQALLDAGAVKRSRPDGWPWRGRPRKRPGKLSAELLTVVNQTMQPTTMSLWLRPAPQTPLRGQ